MTPPPGAFGRYRILDPRPVDGARRLWAAQDPLLGRDVLVKALHRHSEADERVERFREEIRLHASTSHPALVPLLDAGEDGEWIWLVMERLAGRTLRAEIAGRSRLPVARGLRVLAGVLEPLAALHERRVVHRDVKPENVQLVPALLEPEGRPVLLDLGIAKDRSEAGRTITRHGSGALGSEHYTAPEVHTDPSRASFAADVYSAGVLLYEMLVGRLPIGENRPRIDESVPDAPRWIHEIYARMTASDEHARHPDAAEVLAALRIEIAPDEWARLTRPEAAPHGRPGRLTVRPVREPERAGFPTRTVRRLKSIVTRAGRRV